MQEFQVKHKIRNTLYSKGAAIVLLLLIFWIGKSTFSVFQKERESSANAIQATKELYRLEERKNLLQAEIGRLGTDAGIEEEIRAKYNVSKSGEHFFIIVNDTTTPAKATSTELNWWGKIKKKISF